jgi:hypothetical protein
LAFKWHNSSDPELRLVARCHLDVDPVWSVPKNPCIGSSGARGWFALTSLRFILTIAIIVRFYSCPSHTPFSSHPGFPHRSSPLPIRPFIS